MYNNGSLQNFEIFNIKIIQNKHSCLLIIYSKRKAGDYLDSESASSIDENFPGSKERLRNLQRIGLNNLNSGFPEGIKEENEETSTKTKMSGKHNNFSSLTKKRTEIEKDKKADNHLNPNMIGKK